MQQRYEAKLGVAFNVDARRHIAHEEYLRACKYTNEAKVWFWLFKSAARYDTTHIFASSVFVLLGRKSENDRF